ncbi:MAG: response regulator [Rhodocyclaceae bacterium]
MAIENGVIAGEKRILIVDDHLELRLLVRESLDDGSASYLFQEAGNASEALAALSVFRPQLVILDVMMPGEMDGYRLCELIKSDPALMDIYVVLLTARGQRADIEKGQTVGADLYLVKPFSPDQLIAAVAKIFEAQGR